ncbi:MAG: hypothetical protein ACREM1_01240 [Longimicrobiales bacterium]
MIVLAHALLARIALMQHAADPANAHLRVLRADLAVADNLSARARVAAVAALDAQIPTTATTPASTPSP